MSETMTFTAAINKLIKALKTFVPTVASEQLEDLLDNIDIMNFTVTDLKEILDQTFYDTKLEYSFYSVQEDSGLQRNFYIELKDGQELDQKIFVSINEENKLADTIALKAIFYQLVNILYANEKGQEDMEKINRLNLRGFLNSVGSNSQETLSSTSALTDEDLSSLSKSIDLIGELNDDATDLKEESDYVTSVDVLDKNSELSSVAFSDLIETDIDTDVDEEDEEQEVQAIDFEALNEALNNVFKNVSTEEREILKEFKANAWELEMKQEEELLTAEDVEDLVQSVVTIDSEEPLVMKWQLTTLRNLLQQL